ncbi:MAG TPA: hypothetical protein DEG43_14925 [Acidimicrobiaceae bacterium]|jgi:ribosomal-protein-alanine N-acetyltransferase|nr:hypothetical protein [Acidimicrobiaceae bacterium]
MWSRRNNERGQHPAATPSATTLIGRRLVLRPLGHSDFVAWSGVRQRNEEWLSVWEPMRVPGSLSSVVDPAVFASRCEARAREAQMGTGFGFGLFHGGYLAGEINISSVHRGPFQSAYVGYWIDEAQAGLGLMPEAVVLILRYAFEQLRLHRIQIAIIPRNAPSLRVVEKLGLRNEGTALRYLEINGVWEDHTRFAMTTEEWEERGEQLLREWVF